MTTSVDFPLAPFERAISKDHDILGLLYTGSLGRGTGDRYADLDIQVWVPDAVYAAPAPKQRQIFAYLGEVHFCYPSTPSPGATAFIGPGWQRVDLLLLCAADLEPEAAHAAARVVKDTDGVLARLVAASPPARLETPLAQITAIIEEAIDSQVYLALHNARGAVWSAMGEISHQAATLYTLLARLRRYESFGFRYVETQLEVTERLIPPIFTKGKLSYTAFLCFDL